jgi:alginate O-acetyltransferase complex protein AlgI
VVFLLVGLWHGSAWTFVLWGALQGALVIGERVLGVAGFPDARAAIPRRAVTFLLVVGGWVLFRASSPSEALHVYRAMVPHRGIDLHLPAAVSQAFTGQAKVALAIGLATVALPRDLVLGRVLQERWTGAPLVARGVVVAVLPYSVLLIAAGSFSPFLYFRF